MAFWGNPVTSGSNSVDYFVSGDALEHPYRNRISAEEEPYTEQVVLLGGDRKYETEFYGRELK